LDLDRNNKNCEKMKNVKSVDLEQLLMHESKNKHPKPKRTSTRISLLNPVKKTVFKRSSTPKTLLKLRKSILTSTRIEQKPFKCLTSISVINERKTVRQKSTKKTWHNSRHIAAPRVSIIGINEAGPKFAKVLNGSFLIGDYKLWIL